MGRWQWERAWTSAVLILLALSLTACTPHKAQEEPPVTSTTGESLRVCAGTTYSILLAIAEQKGFFAKEGLKVEMQSFAIGRDALEAMIAGSCDVATSADTPVADYGLKRDDLRVFAGIATSDKLCYIVARKDSGIRKITDLKGRQVGTTKGTAPHFFLDLVLSKHRLTEEDLILQFLKGEELHAALRNGTLAAIATTDLNAFRLREELGEAVVLINEPGMSLNHGYLTTLDPTLVKKRATLKRLLTGIRSAEQLTETNPEEARRLFSAYLKVSPQIADQVWASITPRLSLEPAMILTLEDNARWLKEREKGKPVHKSFKTIIRPELLREVVPDAVTLH